MIIAGFGDSVASMYTFPTALLDDNYAEAAPQATKAVPLASGVLDVRGATPNAIAAQTVDKSFVLITTPTADTASASKTLTNPGTHSGNVGHVDIVPGSVVVHDISGTGADDGAGNLIDSVATVRGSIDYATGNYVISTDFFDPIITSFDFNYITGYTPKWADLGTALDALRTATIARGESKLWALMRDGTYRWTWAKCVQFKAPERVGQINHAPVSLRFYCRGGLWYSETLHSLTTDGDDVLNNAGNTIAHFTATLAASAAGAMNIEIQHTYNVIQSLRFQTEWTGTATAGGDELIIDSQRSSVTLEGVGVYAGLTTVYKNEWLALLPGDNQIRILTGLNVSLPTYTWYDTWVM